MKNKLWYLTKYSLKKKFKSKAFILVNILLLILIPLIFNIDSVIKFFGGDFEESTKVYVIDNTGNTYEVFESVFDSNEYLFDSIKVELDEADKTKEELIKEIDNDKTKDIIIEINNDKENIFNAKITSYEYVDTFVYQGIETSLNTTKESIALLNSDIDSQELESIYKKITIEREYISDKVDENYEFITMISNYLIPIFIIPFFFLLILVVQFVGAEINEEKTSKSMEIIITSVSPKTHFFSKILSVNLFVIVQSILLIVYAVIGGVLRTIVQGTSIQNSFGVDITSMINNFVESGVLTNILKALPFIIILFILSFLAYSLLAGVLASITTNAEDFQQLQTPMMIFLMLGYYLALISATYVDAVFIKIFSFIPFISGILAPVLLIQGQIGLIEVLISIALLLLVIFVLIKYGLRIYKKGILNYSSSKLWNKMFKSIKKEK